MDENRSGEQPGDDYPQRPVWLQGFPGKGIALALVLNIRHP